jgi:uncharacterized protein
MAATATGFLGSLHCIGMCGTAAASIISRQPVKIPTQSSTQMPTMPLALNTAIPFGGNTKTIRISVADSTSGKMYLGTVGTAARSSLLFNSGRITSYIVAGTLVAGIASVLAGQIVMRDLMPLRLALFVMGQLLVIATGFYIAGYTKPLAPFERAGQMLWRHLQRWITPLLKRDSGHDRVDLFLLGALWGWIPCGMVYAMLASAMASGSAQNGALVMFGFGLGTLPAMFAAGTAAIPLRKLAQKPNIRIAAGASVVALGVYGLSHTGSLADFAALGAMCVSAIKSIS